MGYLYQDAKAMAQAIVKVGCGGSAMVHANRRTLWPVSSQCVQVGEEAFPIL